MKRARDTEEKKRVKEKEQMETQAEPELTGQGGKKFRLTGSLAAKTAAFILLFVSIAAGAVSGAGCYLAASEGVYFDGGAALLADSVYSPAHRVAFEIRNWLEEGYEDRAVAYLKKVNAEVAILRPEDKLAYDSSVFVWKSYDVKEAKGEGGFYSDQYHDVIMAFNYSFSDEKDSDYGNPEDGESEGGNQQSGERVESGSRQGVEGSGSGNQLNEEEPGGGSQQGEEGVAGGSQQGEEEPEDRAPQGEEEKSEGESLQEDPFRDMGLQVGRSGEEYVFRVFIDMEMSKEDDIRRFYELASLFCRLRFVMIGVLAGSVLLALLCFIFLLCSAGHRNGREGIAPGLSTELHFDVVTVVVCGALVLLSGLFVEATYFMGDAATVIAGGIALLAAGILLMLWLMDFAILLKLGKWWRHTVIYVVVRAVWRGLSFVAGGICRLLKKLPLVMTVMTVYLGVCILELFGLLLFWVDAEAVFLWGLEKAVLFIVVLYLAVVCRRLLIASRELAEGHEDYRVNTEHLFGAFREHGENLNSLGQGISKAVTERMRSEHLKTELITNVSHDLKTPLTSIINYANLICEEETGNPRITEYSEVLLRQSGRLKKLLEDLVEASKATTGNLEVSLSPCEAGILLTQAVGEYQQRMEEKGLELRDRQPEQPVKILADGRHLWRVFDNLLNNICKYAQENSRVYLSLEQREDKVFIIFRNMSKYALNISPEELEERFVRGDRSRHMEGNGLGLSIARSLTELQNGKLDIVVDGDLFKVTLTFQALKE